MEIEPIFAAQTCTSLSPVYTLKFAHDVNVPSIVDAYRADPSVEYAEPNYIWRVTEVPNDANYSVQWAHATMDSERAWDLQTGNHSIIIAIIDTGVDWDHPDLAANIWVNPAESFNGIDDDGNGYVDDVRGWDFVDTPDAVWPGEDGTVRDNNPMDFHGHGTKVAGVAGAVTNNSRGVAGMSWTCTLMAVRAGYKNATGGGELRQSDVAPAIIYATDHGASIISMSFGGYNYSSLVRDAVDYAYDAGVFLVAAAGNDNVNTTMYPAGYPNVVAVAATNANDEKAWFSNHGPWIDVSAPSVNVYSTMFNDTYLSASGTSMATPYVSGLAGLIRSKKPTLTPDDVRTVIRNSTDPTNSVATIGTGRVNAYEALLYARTYHEPPYSVGGVAIPINILALFTPSMGMILFSAVVLLVVVYVRKHTR